MRQFYDEFWEFRLLADSGSLRNLWFWSWLGAVVVSFLCFGVVLGFRFPDAAGMYGLLGCLLLPETMKPSLDAYLQGLLQHTYANLRPFCPGSDCSAQFRKGQKQIRLWTTQVLLFR